MIRACLSFLYLVLWFMCIFWRHKNQSLQINFNELERRQQQEKQFDECLNGTRKMRYLDMCVCVCVRVCVWYSISLCRIGWRSVLVMPAFSGSISSNNNELLMAKLSWSLFVKIDFIFVNSQQRQNINTKLENEQMYTLE